jgi:hypothetical protein
MPSPTAPSNRPKTRSHVAAGSDRLEAKLLVSGLTWTRTVSGASSSQLAEHGERVTTLMFGRVMKRDVGGGQPTEASPGCASERLICETWCSMYSTLTEGIAYKPYSRSRNQHMREIGSALPKNGISNHRSVQLSC